MEASPYTILSILFLFIIAIDIIVLYIKKVFNKFNKKELFFIPSFGAIFLICVTGFIVGVALNKLFDTSLEGMFFYLSFIIMLFVDFITKSIFVYTKDYISFNLRILKLKDVTDIQLKEYKYISKIILITDSSSYTQYILSYQLNKFNETVTEFNFLDGEIS
ncbi:MAG: hypothetical protein ACRC7N_20505 [Clostridium sp.]